VCGVWGTKFIEVKVYMLKGVVAEHVAYTDEANVVHIQSSHKHPTFVSA